MNNNDVVIGIDQQNDFHLDDAPLKVPGAMVDIIRSCQFIRNLNPKTIIATQDSHYPLCISHSSWYTNADGSPIKFHIPIYADDLRNGKYVARYDPVGTLKYHEDLEAQGEFINWIWPEHCIMGSVGHAFVKEFSDVLREWSIKNMVWPILQMKGQDPRTEAFGPFRANIPNANPATQPNQALIQQIARHDRVFILGQARSHCVLNGIKQLLEIEPLLATKMIIVEDCMSDVQGLPADFYQMVENKYKSFLHAGVKAIKSTDI